MRYIFTASTFIFGLCWTIKILIVHSVCLSASILLPSPLRLLSFPVWGSYSREKHHHFYMSKTFQIFSSFSFTVNLKACIWRLFEFLLSPFPFKHSQLKWSDRICIDISTCSERGWTWWWGWTPVPGRSPSLRSVLRI